MTRMSIILSAARAVAVSVTCCASSSVAQAHEPAEPPPPGFIGPAYVDSEGCGFARVTVAGRVGWIPRMGPDHGPMCEFAPTVVASLVPLPAPGRVGPSVVRAERLVGLATTRPFRRPEVMDRGPGFRGTPQAVLPVRAGARPMSPVMRAGPTTAWAAPGESAARAVSRPYVLFPPNRDLADLQGRSACADQGHRASNAMTAEVRCHPDLKYPAALIHGERHSALALPNAAIALRDARPSVPSGYRIAWDEGRLKPDRGLRTAPREAQMRRVLTYTAPPRPVSGAR